MAKKKVLFVSPVPPPLGGMATYTQDYLKSGIVDSFDVIHVNSDCVGKLRYSGIFRQIMNVINCIVLFLLFSGRLFFRRPAIVHVATNSYAGFFEKALLILWARVCGARTVLHIHGGAFKEFYKHSSLLSKWLIVRSLQSSSISIVLLKELKAFLCGIGISPEKVKVLENSVFMPPKHGLRDRNGTLLRVLFLNRIDPDKGLWELLESTKAVCQKYDNIIFEIVGPTTKLNPKLEKFIADNGLIEKVAISGPVIGKEKAIKYRNSDIYVLPSYIEGMPIGLLEAMSYGLPCIVTPVGAIPNLIRDGENGFLVGVKDTVKLTEAIEKLVGNVELRKEIGRAARRTIEEKYNWDKRASGIVDLYNSLLR